MKSTKHTLFLAFLAGILSTFAVAEEQITRHENVLGTSLELRVDAPKDEASRVEKLVLNEIDRLAKILSRHDASSELMLWQTSKSATGAKVSTELKAVLERAEHWRQKTGGAFEVRSAALSALWRDAESKQKPVNDASRQGIVSKLSKAPYSFDKAGKSTRNDDLPIDLDGLAKGYILDAVCATVSKTFPKVENFSINIGGDVRKQGSGPLQVSIESPFSAKQGAKPLTSFVADQSIAVATSGNYRRHFKIQGRKYSHIIDPRSGLPAGRVVSATVTAKSGVDADALATSLSVLSPEDGVQLIDSIEGSECLLVLSDGKQVTSRAWPGIGSKAGEVASANPKEASGLHVRFTLNKPKRGRYRRPYVAVWLEDSDGFPVKTAVLWIQTTAPGPRWHRDLTRWYRNDRTRKLVEKTKLIGTISGATRGPGEYEAFFDGTDNAGEPLPDGKYTLCLEAAREHGTYQIIRKKLNFQKGASIAPATLKGNVEIRKASYKYVP